MQTSNEFVHAPLAKLDYGFDWSLWLDTGETVTTSSWTVSGLTSSDASNTGTVTAVFVEGGVVGQTPIHLRNFFDAGHHAAPAGVCVQKRIALCAVLRLGHWPLGHDSHRPQPARACVCQSRGARAHALGQRRVGHHVS